MAVAPSERPARRVGCSGEGWPGGHGPNKRRVNAQLMSLDDTAECFNEPSAASMTTNEKKTKGKVEDVAI